MSKDNRLTFLLVCLSNPQRGQESSWISALMTDSHSIIWQFMLEGTSWGLYTNLPLKAVSHEARTSSSGLCLARPWKPPRIETAEHLWATCSTARLFLQKKYVYSCWVRTFLVSLYSLFFFFFFSLILKPHNTHEKLVLSCWYFPCRCHIPPEPFLL